MSYLNKDSRVESIVYSSEHTDVMSTSLLNVLHVFCCWRDIRFISWRKSCSVCAVSPVWVNGWLLGVVFLVLVAEVKLKHMWMGVCPDVGWCWWSWCLRYDMCVCCPCALSRWSNRLRWALWSFTIEPQLQLTHLNTDYSTLLIYFLVVYIYLYTVYL